MTIASDKVISDINRFLDAFHDRGRMPGKITITKRQFEDLKIGMGKSEEKDWKPRIRSIPIEVQN